MVNYKLDSLAQRFKGTRDTENPNRYRPSHCERRGSQTSHRSRRHAVAARHLSRLCVELGSRHSQAV